MKRLIMRVLVVLAVVALLAALVALGYRWFEHHRWEQHSIRHARARAQWKLLAIRGMADGVETWSGTPPPTTLAELVDWLWTADVGAEKYFGHKSNAMVDFWDEPIVLIVEDGKLKGLASKGQDKTWENGAGDDIVVPYPRPPPAPSP